MWGREEALSGIASDDCHVTTETQLEEEELEEGKEEAGSFMDRGRLLQPQEGSWIRSLFEVAKISSFPFIPLIRTWVSGASNREIQNYSCALFFVVVW